MTVMAAASIAVTLALTPSLRRPGPSVEDVPTEDVPTGDAQIGDAPTEDAPTEDAPTGVDLARRLHRHGQGPQAVKWAGPAEPGPPTGSGPDERDVVAPEVGDAHGVVTVVRGGQPLSTAAPGWKEAVGSMLLGKDVVHGTGEPGSQTTIRFSCEPVAVVRFCVW